MVDRSGARPIRIGALPEAARGLAVSVKNYERQTIEAAVKGGRNLAEFALFTNPIVADWEAAQHFVDGMT